MLALLRALVSVEGVDVAKAGLSAVSKGFESTASVASGVFTTSINTAVSAIASIAAVAAGATAAVSSMAAAIGTESALKFDSLSRGLASVSRDAGDLMGQLDRLREVAKLPGLGFEEAVAGSLALQSAGLSANMAERSLMAFGNALATVGKGKAELDGVTLALQQIASKGKVSAEEINQLNERVPQIRKAMQAAFGTADTEVLGKMGIGSEQFIAGVVAQFEKLPKMLSGPQNAIENFGNALKVALMPLGQGILAMFTSISGPLDTALGKLGQIATAIGEVFAAVGKSGVLGKALSDLFGGSIDAGAIREKFVGIAASIVTVVGNLRGEFDTLTYNMREAWDFATSLLDNIAAKAQVILNALKPHMIALLEMGKAFAAVFGTTMFLNTQIISQLVKEGTKGLSEQLAQVDKDKPLNRPDFRKFGNVMQGYDSIAAQIRGNLGPLSPIPEGVNFGGPAASQAQAQQASSTIWAQWDKYLAGIERNTARTADAITSRRTSGGGELAQMGISGAELRKRTAARNGALYGRA